MKVVALNEDKSPLSAWPCRQKSNIRRKKRRASEADQTPVIHVNVQCECRSIWAAHACVLEPPSSPWRGDRRSQRRQSIPTGQPDPEAPDLPSL